MSTAIAALGAKFKNPVGHVTVPIRDGLIGEYYFGRTIASSVHDYSGGANLTVAGTPSVLEDEVYLESGSTGLLIPLAVEPQYITLFFVGRKADDGTVCSYLSTVAGGMTGIVQRGGTTGMGFRARDEGNTTIYQATISSEQGTSNVVASMTVSPSETGYTIYARTYDGASVSESTISIEAERAVDAAITRAISIGYGGSFLDGAIYARAAIAYERSMSSDEMASVESYLAKWCL